MSKPRQIIYIIIAITILYVFLSVFVVFLADTTVSVNNQLAVAHNGMVAYPGSSDFILAVPWIMYIAPAVVGIIAVVVVLKEPPGGYRWRRY